ncbi:hypothetical protein HY025_05665 [Candidatus Daviesbacteria bacterium]|nr:hypothetical protein [Candidatus Daviesbacteria bacterium]
MRKSLGFSLFEVILVIGLGAVVGSLILRLLTVNSGVYNDQIAQVNQGLGLNSSISQIESDLKPAAGVVTSYTNGSNTYSSSLNSLVLKLASLDSQGKVLANTFDYIVIVADSSNPKILRRRIFADPSSSRKNANQVLLTNLSLINFFYYDQNDLIVSPSTAVKVNFVLNTASNIGKSSISSASSAVNLRNQ